MAGQVEGGFLIFQLENYLTAFFNALAGRNFGTRMDGTEMACPVRGFRAWRAARTLVEKMPRPAIETSPPFLRVETIESMTISTTSSACAFVPLSFPCTAFAISTLFIIYYLIFYLIILTL